MAPSTPEFAFPLHSRRLATGLAAALILLLSAPPANAYFVAYNDRAYNGASDGQATDPNGQLVHYTMANVTQYAIGAVNHGGTQAQG